MSLKKLWKKTRRRILGPVKAGVHRLPARMLVNADVIITTNEVTDRHGTGVILNRIFGQTPNLLSLRSSNLYGGHCLGAAQLCLDHERLSRAQSFERLLYALNGTSVGRIMCVPFLPDELVSALVLKELFGARLCTFLMDDNNVFTHGIPDELMREALAKSDLRLAISPEMRDAYENKYGLKFWVLPPVVRDDVIQTRVREFRTDEAFSLPGVLVGSIWSQRWLEQLRGVLRGTGLQLHWYGNAQAPWLKTTREELRRDGLIDCGFLPEAELTSLLHRYPYAVIPSGTLDEHDDRPEIARLSLPTRLPYLLAATQTPMLLLGSPESAAARFIERFQVGSVAPYKPAALQEAVARLRRPEVQRHFRRQAARHSASFSAAGLDEWLWRSLTRRQPADERFEQLLPRGQGDIVSYLEPPAPPDLLGDHVLVYHALRRLNRRGFDPDFILDVGASTGVWSDIAHRVFPAARFILVEPLEAQHTQKCDSYFKRHPEFECVPVAVSDRPGRAQLSVSADLYGSSLFQPHDFRSYEPLSVPVSTLDHIARDKQLTGRGLLKIDVQFAEHLVLAGARELLPRVDALIIELSLVGYASQPMLFPEMCELIYELGFSYYEDLGGWRHPQEGTLLQKDVLFIRSGLFQEQAAAPPASATTRLEPDLDLAIHNG